MVIWKTVTSQLKPVPPARNDSIKSVSQQTRTGGYHKCITLKEEKCQCVPTQLNLSYQKNCILFHREYIDIPSVPWSFHSHTHTHTPHTHRWMGTSVFSSCSWRDVRSAPSCSRRVSFLMRVSVRSWSLSSLSLLLVSRELDTAV